MRVRTPGRIGQCMGWVVGWVVLGTGPAAFAQGLQERSMVLSMPELAPEMSLLAQRPVLLADVVVPVVPGPATSVPTTTTPASPIAPPPDITPSVPPASPLPQPPWPEPAPPALPTPPPAPPPPSRPLTPMERLKQSGKRWIEIDTSRQRLFAWEGDKQVYAVIVSTGKPSTPTPSGVFAIQSRHRYARMRGADYDVPDVPYTMYYSGNYAIHGAYWHNRFGTPVSHGCVNVAVDHAKWLFEWASLGTPVVVHR
ncbi:L,D-transpeptidase [Trichothermofontia sichuanensis B231]|uniref:L,D-transpeptidase n=1 Tax=Trichothermofontia sichuanensis TaxID=3045816 RepID=UPI0022453575|nr:L,D-transpeptidase [Trichothermofontia sichuanensis B231]